jgi:hypothetical protein
MLNMETAAVLGLRFFPCKKCTACISANTLKMTEQKHHWWCRIRFLLISWLKKIL